MVDDHAPGAGAEGGTGDRSLEFVAADTALAVQAGTVASDLEAKTKSHYALILNATSEQGVKAAYQIPDEMAQAGATLWQMYNYAALGNEVWVGDRKYKRDDLSRPEQDIRALLLNEMQHADGKPKEWQFLFVDPTGKKTSVHGNNINFPANGTQLPDNRYQIHAIVTGGTSWGYKK